MHGVRSGLLRPPRGDEKNVYNDEGARTLYAFGVHSRSPQLRRPTPGRMYKSTLDGARLG